MTRRSSSGECSISASDAGGRRRMRSTRPAAHLERPGERERDQVEHAERHGGPHRDRLGPLDRQRLGRQLAEHRVQEGDDRRGWRRRPACARSPRSSSPGRCSSGRISAANAGSPSQPERQRRQRDAELAGRQVGGELRGDAEQQARRPVPSPGQLLEPGGADLDERELRCDEERVRQDHHHREEQCDGRMHCRGGSHNQRSMHFARSAGPGLLVMSRNHAWL